ncbi:DUF7351 domain-containing protein [Saliphagus infecundisoli]|uniref:DUF7351 domain-containing protein n=1 Tax=Saliphagus infecundisoli TaxID=1849069 RepID=UPI003CCCD789
MGSSIENERNDRLTPQSAFQLLGHEIRIEILWALWTAPDHTATFSTLREEVRIDDNGRLNYHRDQLTGHFIEPAADNEGYTLQQAGLNVIRAIHAGTFTDRSKLESESIDGTCPDCRSQLRFRYVDGMTNVFCPDCEQLWDEYAFPPGGLPNWDETDLAVAGDVWGRHELSLAQQGMCPACGSQMSAALVSGSDEYFGHPLHVRYECNRCEFHPRASLGEAVLGHPAVVSLFHDHGTDIRSVPRWQLSFCFDDDYIEVTSQNPLRGRVFVPCGDEVLDLSLDTTGEVVKTRYVPTDRINH